MSADICDREHKGRSLLSYPEAVGRLVMRAAPLGGMAEEVPLPAALGRTLAESVRLDRDEPPARRSAMDGFAVRSADGAAPRKILGSVFAGTSELPEVGPGEAAAIMTGGTVPPGADAVVPVAQTRRRTEGDGEILEIDEPPAEGAHVRNAGEMGRKGRQVLEAGTPLTGQDLTACAGCGVDPVKVAPRARVALLSTGDEVVPHTQTPGPHQVRDSNRLGSTLQLQRAGAQMVVSEHVDDDFDQLLAAVSAALELSDLVVTIGGVSMGDKDHLPNVFRKLGVEELFHGVSVQPGKPVWAGTREGAFVLGLPGNPVSSFVILELFAVPLLERLHGQHPHVPRPLRRGMAGGNASTRARERFFPADLHVEESGTVIVTPRPSSGSGDWTSLAGTTALLHVPAHSGVAPGDPVDYLPLG